MNSRWSVVSVLFVTLRLATACGSSSSSADYRIVPAQGTALTAAVGDALRLSVVEVLANGTTTALASTATVAWSGPPLVTALPEGSSPAESILPQPAASATAMWVRNPEHLTDAQLNGVLYVLDKGSAPNPALSVTATVGGDAPAGTATATIAVTAFPTGDVTRGQTLFADNCASCHGAAGEGSDIAPGLNNSVNAQGDPSVAADPSWGGPLFAVAPLSNVDNAGVSLSMAMPRWLLTEARSGSFLTTQNLADVYAFLKTQTTPAP